MAGRPEKESDGDILRAIESVDEPFATTSEVADNLDIKKEGTLKRLHDLSDRGLVGSRQIGGPYVWWITDKGESYLAGELDESDGEA